MRRLFPLLLAVTAIGFFAGRSAAFAGGAAPGEGATTGLGAILERRAAGDPAHEDLKRLAETGEPRAALLYGLALLGEEAADAQTAARAAAFLQMAADAAEPQAQFMLGLLHERGKGVDRNPTQAARWYRFAAAAGDAEAMFRLGALHDAGEGVKLDPVRAAALYRQSAEAGFVPAMVSLAAMYETGQGVEQDRLAARAWYEKAAPNDRFAARRARDLAALDRSANAAPTPAATIQ